VAQRVSIEEKDWTLALVLGSFRKCYWEIIDKPKEEQKRGSLNLFVDLQGLIGEIVVVRDALRRGATIGYHSVLDLGPSYRPGDVQVDSQHLEVKGKILRGFKNEYVLANCAAFDRTVSSGVTSLVPVVTHLASPVALLADAVPAKDVQSWEVLAFHYGAPAYARRLRDDIVDQVPKGDEEALWRKASTVQEAVAKALRRLDKKALGRLEQRSRSLDFDQASYLIVSTLARIVSPEFSPYR